MARFVKKATAREDALVNRFKNTYMNSYQNSHFQIPVKVVTILFSVATMTSKTTTYGKHENGKSNKIQISWVNAHFQ